MKAKNSLFIIAAALIISVVCGCDMGTYQDRLDNPVSPSDANTETQRKSN